MVFFDEVKKIEEKYKINLFDDVINVANNRVLFVMDLKDNDSTIHVIRGDLTAINLPNINEFKARDILSYIEPDNKLAEIEGKDNFIDTIVRQFKYFDKNLYLWLPLKSQTNEPLWLYVGLDRVLVKDKKFIVGQVLRVYYKTPSPITHYQKTYQDSLTNLFTRETLKMHMDYLTSTQNSYVMYLDIDNFKRINDKYGHHIGDQFLIDIANHFISKWEHNVLYYRLGGDEFYIYCYDHDHDQIINRAKQVINDIENLNDMAKELKISLSVGIVKITEANKGYHKLLNLSDEAMYQSKERGPGNFTVLGE